MYLFYVQRLWVMETSTPHAKVSLDPGSALSATSVVSVKEWRQTRNAKHFKGQIWLQRLLKCFKYRLFPSDFLRLFPPPVLSGGVIASLASDTGRAADVSSC